MSEPASEIIIELRPSKGRYWFGLVAIGMLGLFMLWLAATGPNLEFLGRFIIFAMALPLIYLTSKIYSSGLQAVILTEDGLIDTQGRAICAFEQIESVDRSFFAFKPSNGFLLRLKEPLDRAWHPGLWWRIGRRVGVGGITSAANGKAMADAINMLLVTKNNPEALEAFGIKLDQSGKD